MKKPVICTMLVILTATSFCQPQSAQTTTRDEYLTKSKTQKVFGCILLAAGATTLAIISKGTTNLDAVGPLAVGGGLATLASIPLFISSGRNKRRAMNVATNFKLESTHTVQQAGINYHPFPALSVSVNFHKR